VRKLIVTAFGLGTLPLVPGTWGSAGAVVVYAGLWFVATRTASQASWLTHVMLAALMLAACLACVWLGPWAVREYDEPDPRACVIDEVAGQWLALLVVPAQGWTGLAAACGVQFVFFRAFDIVKPPPARRAERLPAGWGILADDLVAGLYANLLGQVILRCFWKAS